MFFMYDNYNNNIYTNKLKIVKCTVYIYTIVDDQYLNKIAISLNNNYNKIYQYYE